MSDIEFCDLGETYDADLLDQVYREVYLPAFPLRDEQEDPSIWTPRLLDPNANPRLCYLVAGRSLVDSARRKLFGLLVAEYYAASQSVLISYVAVGEGAREKGLARRMYMELQQRLAVGCVSQGRPVRAVFAEIHDPAMSSEGCDVLDPQDRLCVMDKLGGERIPIRYVQPALAPDQAPAGGLMLIAFPTLAMNAPALTADCVRDFLVEFYRQLGIVDPEHDPVYSDIFDDIKALEHRSRVFQPLLEVNSKLQLSKAAVAIQFAAAHCIQDDVKACEPTEMYCKYFHSYEKDLLSHAFRNPPPVRSHCVPNTIRAEPTASDYVLDARLLLPSRLRFQTEGKKIARRRGGIDALPVTLSFSRSDFLQSDRSILNVVVHIDLADNGATFGEYELLCLSKLWCAEDESETWLIEDDDEGAWFEIGTDRLRLGQLATRYLKVSSEPPVGGCVQIVFGESDGYPLTCTVAKGKDAVTTRDLIDALNDIQQEDKPPTPARLRPALNAIGCLLQNIFDMENVDLNELEDMLDGVNTSRSAVTAIHRNTLFAVTVNDRLFKDEARTIGMSPYLLLPQAALLHNERILFEANALLRHVDRIGDALRHPEQKEEVRERLINALRHDMLDDLPGGPDLLIRKTAGWLWKRYRANQKKSVRVHSNDVATFVSELDLAIVEGLSAYARGELSHMLDRDMLGNVFQYSSERWVFEEGGRDRGFDILLDVLRKRTNDLANVMSAAETRHSEWRNSNYAVIGLVFTLYTVIPFEGAIKQVPDMTVAHGDLGWSGLFLLAALGFVLIFTLLWRRVLVLIYMRALGHVVRKLGPKALLPLKLLVSKEMS